MEVAVGAVVGEEEAENAREEEGGGRPGESRTPSHFIVVLVALPGPEDCSVEKQGNTTAEVAPAGRRCVGDAYHVHCKTN